MTATVDPDDSFEKLVQRIQAGFAQTPSVSLPEAQRLWGIDYASSIAVFRVLTDRGAVRRTPRGRYVRV